MQNREQYKGKRSEESGLIMKNHFNPRNRFMHLYNPKEEGLGSYDVHYINAYKKVKAKKGKFMKEDKERYAA